MVSAIKSLTFHQSRNLCCTVKTAWLTSHLTVISDMVQSVANGVPWCGRVWWKSCVNVHGVCSEPGCSESHTMSHTVTARNALDSLQGWVWINLGHWVFRNLLLLPKSLKVPHWAMWHGRRGHCPQFKELCDKGAEQNHTWIPTEFLVRVHKESSQTVVERLAI